MEVYEELKQLPKTEINGIINNFINEEQKEFIRFYKYRHHYTFVNKESLQSFTGFLDIISTLFSEFPFSMVSLLDSFCFLSLSSELSKILTKDVLITLLSSPLSSNYEIKELSNNSYLIEDKGDPLLFLFDVSDTSSKKYIISFISSNVSIDTLYPEVYKDNISKIQRFMTTAFLKLLKEYLEVSEYGYKIMKE